MLARDFSTMQNIDGNDIFKKLTRSGYNFSNNNKYFKYVLNKKNISFNNLKRK